MTEQINKIPARLKNMAKNGHVAGADDIIDDVLNKTQNQVNQDLIGADKTEKSRAESAELALRNAVGGLTQSKVIVGALPASGAASTIYRVPGTNSYSDYAWNGSQFVLMATYNNAIDDVPTAGSDNLVKSGGAVSAYGYNKSQTESATQGTNYDNNFTNINIKQGEVFKVKATGDAIAANINLYINNPQGTSLGNVNVNGSAVEIVAPSDITTLCCYKYSGYVTASGSLTIEVLIEGSVIRKQLEPINATIENHAESISSLNTTTGTHTTDIAELKADNGYYVCDTVAANSTKSVAVPGYVLNAGGSIKIKMLYATTTMSATLNINQTGAKTLYYNGSAAGDKNNWADGEVVEVFYDGTNYYANSVNNKSRALEGNISYSICSSAGGSPDKNLSVPGYQSFVGGCMYVKFEHANTTSSTIYLDINSGANKKPLYYEGAPVSPTNTWTDNEVVRIWTDGTNFYANKIDIRRAIEQDIASLENFHDKTVTETGAATSGSSFGCTITYPVIAGRRYSIKVDADEGVISGLFNFYKDNITSANEIGSHGLGQEPFEFIADTNITRIIVYRSAAGVVGSGNVTVTFRDFGSVLSEVFERDNAFVRSQEVTIDASMTSMPLQVRAQIKKGEYFILRVIDKDNALNGTIVQTFKGLSITSANAIEAFYGNNVSNVYKAEEDIDWIGFYSRPATGSSFNSGSVYGEVHRSQYKDALMEELYNMSQNTGSSSVIVDVVNPYWSESWQGSILHGESSQIKGIYVKFDSITIHTGSERIVKTWSDLKTDLPSAVYGIAGDNMTDTLLLSIYSYANQILYYDQKEGKFKIANDNATIEGKYILLAYAKNGSIGGEICRQHNDRLTLNKNPYLTEPNTKYLETLRTKEMELLDTKNFFTIGWCSDTHYSLTETNGTPINVTNAIMNDIDGYIGLDAIINTGDLILYGSQSKKQGLCALQKTFRTINIDKFMVAVGNHDFNSVADGTTINKKDWIITDSELETFFFRKIKTTARLDGKLYYYRDFDEKKVRVISLNTMDIPIEFNTDDTIKYDPVGVHGFRQAQLEWLANTALDLTSKSDAENWKIIVIMHVGSYLFPGGNFVHNADKFNGIINAFVNKGTFNYTEADANYDFFDVTNLTGDFTGKEGKLIAVLNGHGHHDAYENSDGFNAIQIKASYNNPIDMLPETYNEFSIDVIILDDVQEKIILKRFGNYSVSDNPNGDREYPYDVTT